MIVILIKSVDMVPRLRVILFLEPCKVISVLQSIEVVDLVFLGWRHELSRIELCIRVLFAASVTAPKLGVYEV